MTTPILDMTAGSRMFWWDKDNPLVTFVDKRSGEYEIGTYHTKEGEKPRKIVISPDIQCDWAKDGLPFPDESFSLVVFDPPHLIHAGEKSWLAKKYGVLEDTWPADIKRGVDEAMRVLKPHGTLIFKWNHDQIRLQDVLTAIGRTPLFGDKKSKTHWLFFFKEEV